MKTTSMDLDAFSDNYIPSFYKKWTIGERYALSRQRCGIPTRSTPANSSKHAQTFYCIRLHTLQKRLVNKLTLYLLLTEFKNHTASLQIIFSYKPVICQARDKVWLDMQHVWNSGMAHWWEHSPPTNVAQIRFPDAASCGLSLLVLYSAPRGFLRVLRFPLS